MSKSIGNSPSQLALTGRIPLLVGIGATLLVVGVGLLTTWEFEVFRATTFDRDFTGLVCGAPLDNPGWTTGSPCHGAVNRQTGFAMIVTTLGIATIVASLVSTATWRRQRRPTG